jgi:hypothetical protein
MTSVKQNRIKLACRELELAIQSFEDDSDKERRALAEEKKLKELKTQLEEIKRQLDQLS